MALIEMSWDVKHEYVNYDVTISLFDFIQPYL